MSNRAIAFGLVIVFMPLASLIIGVGGLGLHAMNELNLEARNIRAQQWKDVQGYFGDCRTPSVLRSLESWLRRRLRSVMWKQWKQGRTRFRELRKRVGKDLAAPTAGSPHGSWRIANSPALAIALPNAYFAQLGLQPMVVRSA